MGHDEDIKLPPGPLLFFAKEIWQYFVLGFVRWQCDEKNMTWTRCVSFFWEARVRLVAGSLHGDDGALCHRADDDSSFLCGAHP